MNEVQLIRSQLNVERQHAAEVSRACATAMAGDGSLLSRSSGAAASGADPPDAGALAGLVAFRQAGVDYLVSVLTRFEVREQTLHDLFRDRYATDDPNRRAMEAALAQPGTCRDALKALAIALEAKVDSAGAASRWLEFHRFFTGPWSTRRDEIDRLFGGQAKVTDWRTVSDIDADSIIDERTRYARVKATLPAGIEMTPAAASRP